MRLKKLLIIILFFILTLIPTINAMEIKGYDEFEIPSGTLIPVISLQEFSTAYNDETDILHFVATNDIFMFEHRVLPKGARLTGYIEKKNEPIIGTNATMKIFINKMVLPDGFEIPLKGYIYHANNNTFGGELTEPESYVKVPHYDKAHVHNFMGVIQFRPGATRKMGEHITIASGADLLVVLVAPIQMTHMPIED